MSDIKKCENCHAELSDDAAFCAACGTPVVTETFVGPEATAAPSSAGAGIPPYTPPTPPQSSYQAPQPDGQSAFGAFKNAPFFKALFDFNFTKWFTPTAIRIIYIVGVVIAAIGAGIGLISAFASGANTMGWSPLAGFGIIVVALVVTPLAFIVYVVILRLALESVLASIRTADVATRYAEKHNL